MTGDASPRDPRRVEGTTISGVDRVWASAAVSNLTTAVGIGVGALAGVALIIGVATRAIRVADAVVLTVFVAMGAFLLHDVVDRRRAARFHSMLAATPTADVFRALADWAARALRSSEYDLDYQPTSLWELERFFEEQVEGGRARRGGLLADETAQRLIGLGAYLGEVIRRRSGGDWPEGVFGDQASADVALRLPDGSVIWPIRRVFARFADGEENDVAVYAAVLGVDVGPRPLRPDHGAGSGV